MLGAKQTTPIATRLGLTYNWKLPLSPGYYNHIFFMKLNLSLLFNPKNKSYATKTSPFSNRNFVVLNAQQIITARLNLLIFYYPSTAFVAKVRADSSRRSSIYAKLQKTIFKKIHGAGAVVWKPSYKPSKHLVIAVLGRFYFKRLTYLLTNLLAELIRQRMLVGIHYHNILLDIDKPFIAVAQQARRVYGFLTKLGSLNYLFIALYYMMRYAQLFYFSTMMTVWAHKRKTLKHYEIFNLYFNLVEIFWHSYLDYRRVHAIRFLAQGSIGRHGRAKQYKFKIGVVGLATYSNYVDFFRSTITSPYGSIGFKYWIC